MSSQDKDSQLALAVKQRRVELKLSREELAELMSAPLDVIIEIEESQDSNYVPSKTLRRLLSIALNVTEGEFFKSLTDASAASAASALSATSDVSALSAALDAWDALTDTEQRLPEQPSQEQRVPKPLFLPPMFSRTRSDEQKISTVDNDNQLAQRFDLPAIPANPNSPLPRKTKGSPSEQIRPKQKSPFIPRHAVQKTHPINLSVCKPESNSVSIANSSALTPVADLNVVVTSPINSKVLKNVTQSSVAIAQSYVPLVPHGLSAVQSQKETGIFQIQMAPDPVAFQTIREDFGKDVPGLTLNTTRVTDSKKLK